MLRGEERKLVLSLFVRLYKLRFAGFPVKPPDRFFICLQVCL